MKLFVFGTIVAAMISCFAGYEFSCFAHEVLASGANTTVNFAASTMIGLLCFISLEPIVVEATSVPAW